MDDGRLGKRVVVVVVEVIWMRVSKSSEAVNQLRARRGWFFSLFFSIFQHQLSEPFTLATKNVSINQ